MAFDKNPRLPPFSSLSDSMDQLEQKIGGQTNASEKCSVAEGQAVSSGAEYERYLDLHRQFEGPKRKKLLRKREILTF